MVAVCCAAVGVRSELVRVAFEGTGTAIAILPRTFELMSDVAAPGLSDALATSGSSGFTRPSVHGFYEYDSSVGPIRENLPETNIAYSLTAPVTRLTLSISNLPSPAPEQLELNYQSGAFNYLDARGDPYWEMMLGANEVVHTELSTGLATPRSFPDTSGSWRVSLRMRTPTAAVGDFRRFMNASESAALLNISWQPYALSPNTSAVPALNVGLISARVVIDSIRVVPEPSTAMLGLLASAAGFFVARRRRRG